MKHEIIPMMADCRVGTAHQSRFCHCERSEAISLHNSLFLVRHSIFTTTFTFLLVLFLIASPAYAKYGGGTGEPNDPYLIFDANQMNEIGLSGNWDDWDKHFILMADIDLTGFTGTSFNIIGNYYNRFTGSFDGDGHKILNFTYSDTEGGYIGLFGAVDGTNSEVKDLGVINPNIGPGSGGNVGSIIGRLFNGTVTNCYVNGGNVSGAGYVGGIVGLNQGVISRCYSTTSVTEASEYLGGLAGSNEGNVTHCYSTGNVEGDRFTGGLIGVNYGAISESYATGSVSANIRAGGLIGLNHGGIVFNSYSTGSILGDSYVGGLVGDAHSGATVTNSFWDTETSGQTTSAGGTGKTTAEMQMMSTFTDAGWDFVGESANGEEDIWKICEGLSYPHLSWETPLFLDAVPDQFFVNVIPPKVILDASSPCNQLSYQWRQVAGPSVILEGGDEPIVSFIPTEFGVYVFELTASDGQAGGTDMVTVYIEERYAGGSGTAQNPCQIRTAEHMNEIGLHPEDWSRHFKLMADINLAGYTGTDFNIIGSYGNPFAGVFDGNGHTIFNFTYNSNDTNYVGLFGCVSGENAEIKNLGLIDPNLDTRTGWNVGSLVGYIREATITNCYVEGGSISGIYSYHVGGLVGYASHGTITNCYSTAGTSGAAYVAGLVGYASHGTITNCYSEADVSGIMNVGGLVGYNRGTINNCYTSADVSGNRYVVGGLVGWNRGTINNCYSEGVVTGDYCVGGLVGRNWYGTVYNCYATGSVSGDDDVGGLVGDNEFGTINNCYTSADVSGDERVGGLVGDNYQGTITDSYSSGSISGNDRVGGLMGENEGRIGIIANCYSTGSVSGNDNVGGLVGQNGRCYSWGCRPGTVSTCYSTGSVSGDDNVGGLVGWNWGTVTASFWDIETSGQSTSAGGMGKTTAGMQTESTFTDAGWDFETPVWTIDEGVDYPRLWWEIVPVLHAEPEVTLGTTNTISWEPIPGANDYYAECAADANFTSIIYNTGWITEASYEFTGLELGKRYWYSVKARNSAGVETNWSNVESSLQVTLTDAVDAMLDPDTLKNKNMKNALLNKINTVQQMLDAGRYEKALNKLQNNILQKTDGCAETGRPDKNDWIITCQGQSMLYPLVIETIENVKGLMNQ